MITNQQPVVLTSSSIEAGDEETVEANVSIVDAMHQALLRTEEISPVAVRSYYVDFYLAQVLEGGFAQYVFMTLDRDDTDTLIREGLVGMGATAHLDLFNRTAEFYDVLSAEDREQYLDGGLDDGDPAPVAVVRMEELDGEFEELLESENVTALNAAWLRSQPDLVALDDEDVDAYIARVVGLIPDLAERQAEADAEALAEAPDFEVIIRELCSVAGYELEKITMGDPNYVYDGVKTLAWHFSTDHGDFLMVEEEDEAFMLNPETLEIVAAIEFAEAGLVDA
ncbi:hypothetical protein PSET11_00938 [Arthrobacter ulcerisalmonis]|uniref:DNA mimic protein DMP19 C-terminal domain-containing protein n=1 Tax=Arthrobacter ulcerisalmonis TaxID=2483813 RepID=A0A3P5WFW3_9MICC|nr:hypothetical protein [Arthrobacter ulcerisalmonis]VDC22413.1 hypothetical protein PSET11_00938 [Arthrobacter ulcerisalmonis]